MAEEESQSFADLGLRKELVETLTRLGYEAPTPIQQRTIPVLLAGSDLIGQAQTGTGKTAAFALPMLQKIDPKERTTQGLVLTPTRELAIQVAEAIHTYARDLNQIIAVPIYGGAPMGPQLKRLERGAHIVVGTPGRIIDHLKRQSLDLSGIRMLVLDEADEMLRMGFIEDVEMILSEAPASRQIALFSATMPNEIVRMSERYLHDAERVEIEHRAMTTPAIEQRFLNVSENQKLQVLTQLLEIEEYDAVLVFRRTKNGAAELAEKLEARGFAAVALHGDMTQIMRESVVRRLRAGQLEIVVATDVAARGLDVEQITHVVNYDVPNDVEAYVHRIGRTGRAGRTGTATLFITPRERRMMREIEKFTGSSIKPMKVPSSADVAAYRVSQLKEKIRQTIQAGELDLYVELVEQIVDEGSFDVAEVAAAATLLAAQAKSLTARTENALSEPDTSMQRDFSSRERRPRDASESQRPRPERAPRLEHDDRPKARLSIAVGSADGIRPADIVGSIANEANIPGRDIGPIDIRADMTIVCVPEEYAQKIVESVATAKFRGKRLNVRILGSNEMTEESPRRKPSFSRDRDDRPSRPHSSGERGGFKPRFTRDDRGERPAGREDRPFKPKASGEDRGKESTYKPKFARDDRGKESTYKPKFARDDRGKESSYKPKFSRDRDDSRTTRPPRDRDDARPARRASAPGAGAFDRFKTKRPESRAEEDRGSARAGFGARTGKPARASRPGAPRSFGSRPSKSGGRGPAGRSGSSGRGGGRSGPPGSRGKR